MGCTVQKKKKKKSSHIDNIKRQIPMDCPVISIHEREIIHCVFLTNKPHTLPPELGLGN